MSRTLATLRAEHRAIARLLHALEERVARARRRAELPDFALLRAMLFWMAEFPERQHHRKESAALFPRLRARAPLVRHVLDRLEEDHRRGEARIHQLGHALTAFELLGEPRRAPFETMLAEYLDFQRQHMVTEETQVFPLAERVLSSADWADVDGELGEDLDTRGDACGVLFDQLRPTVGRGGLSWLSSCVQSQDPRAPFGLLLAVEACCACGAGASRCCEAGCRRVVALGDRGDAGRRGLPSRDDVRGRLRPAAFARLRCGARRTGLRRKVGA